MEPLVTQAVHHVGGDPLEGARAEDPVVHSSIYFAILREATSQVPDLKPLLVLRATWYNTRLGGEYSSIWITRADTAAMDKGLFNAQQQCESLYS